MIKYLPTPCAAFEGICRSALALKYIIFQLHVRENIIQIHNIIRDLRVIKNNEKLFYIAIPHKCTHFTVTTPNLRQLHPSRSKPGT